MFGFSRRRMKLGRVKKVHLSDSGQGFRSPIRPPKRNSNPNSEGVAPANSHSDKTDCQCTFAGAEVGNGSSGNSENWMVLSIAGDKPTPRFNHAAAVIGNKMIVVGGESANGLLDDVQVLNFDRFTWTVPSSKLYLSASSLPLMIPACSGHSLVSWGKKALLVGGKTDSGSDRVSVWTFDTETECWSLVEAKGNIPVARSGHTVVRSRSVLILFGGEDAKRRKLNDLHMLDLKSLMWLPLHCTGSAPSPRSYHVAALYDDKNLLVFGGVSKSKTLNGLYSLDFKTMAWSRIKIRGFHPSPRAGCCGVLCGTKWYIAGGGSGKKRHPETLIFDVLKMEWSVANTSPLSSITANMGTKASSNTLGYITIVQKPSNFGAGGFSLVLVQHKEKDILLAFGGSKREPSNQVEAWSIEKNESSVGRRSTLNAKGPGRLLFEKCSSSTELASQLSNGSFQRSVDSVPRLNLASIIEQHGSGRKSLSEFSLADTNLVSGNVSLYKQFQNEEEYNAAVKMVKSSEDETSFLQINEDRINQIDLGGQSNISGGKINMDDAPTFESENLNPPGQGIGNFPVDNDDLIFHENDSKSGSLSGPSSIYQFYETKMAALIRKNGILEGQLAAALANGEASEKNLSTVFKSRQEMEKKLADTLKEMELLKEKLAGLELAQEEANSLTNIVHSDNVRLEHDVAFLKAVLNDTERELHSTRGVLAGERARAFQLQVEVFHLKQRLQSLENRALTPGKPFNV